MSIERLRDRIFAALICGLALLICSCNEVSVARDIDQRQALEIVALLNSYGIGAEAAKDRGGFSVNVKKSVYVQATTLMKDHKLPGEARMSFRELMTQQSLIPSTRDVEAVRLDHALAVELEDLLEKMDAVAAAKAVVRVNFRGESSPAGVSIVVQLRAGHSVTAEEIGKLVHGVTPGVPKDNITVSVTTAAAPPAPGTEVGKLWQEGKSISVPLVSFLFWRVPEGSLTEMVATFMAVVGLAIMVGMLGGYALGTYRQSKYLLSREAPEGAALVSFKLDKSRKTLPGA
jgi:type III secretory pathway lipoprotein EscJ